MIKDYYIPEMEIIYLERSDLICTSLCSVVGCTPEDECENDDECWADGTGCAGNCNAYTQ